MPPRTRRVASFVIAADLTTLLVPAWVAWSHQTGRSPQVWWDLLLAVATGATVAAWWVWHRASSIRPLVATLLLLGLVGTTSLVLIGGPAYTGSEPPWILVYHPTAVAMVALVWRRASAVVVAGAVVIGAQVLVEVTDVWHPDDLTRAFLDVLFSAAVLAILHALVLVVGEAESGERAEQERALAGFARARAAEAAARGHTRWDGFVHDEVLAALATLQVAEDPEEVRRVARAAVRAVDAPAEQRAAVDLRDGIIDTALSTYPDAETDLRVDPDAMVLPHEVVVALVEATTEALRNVARHAYPTGHGPASVVLRHDATGVRLEISDLGRGFGTERLSPLSLGLQVSIRLRMSSCGGLGTVTSTRGHGTSVTLAWPDPGSR